MIILFKGTNNVFSKIRLLHELSKYSITMVMGPHNTIEATRI